MTDNIYQPPRSELVDEQQGDNTELQEFYVVSGRKFLTLFILTLGLYHIYWFYKNWKLYKLRNDTSMWPVMRAIFSIFFTHSLFRTVQQRLDEKSLNYDWAPSGLATLYVIFSIVGNISDRISMREIGSPWTDVIGLFTVFGVGYVLYKAQQAINLACGDPDGTMNSAYTAANIAWIVVGALLWGLVFLGLASTFFDI